MLGVVFPGYSHLQQAQPVLFSHVLLSFFEMLQRDFERFISSSKRNNYSPLGAGAIAGSSLPLSPDLVAKKLGFNGSFKNSIDAVSDRDFLLDFVFSASVLMIHLSQISENLILWSTSEFGFIYLPDELITGSSLMPQKRNPDVLELIRARSGRVAGELVNLLFILKALPLGYNRDLQETKRCAVISSDAVRSSLEMMGIIFERIDIDTDRVSQVISEFIFATDIVEFLVKRDVPFRKAYNIVVKLIEYCVRKKLNLSELDANTLGKFHPELRDINLLDPHLSANSKITPGGTSIKNVEKQIKSGWRIIRRNESLCG
jgi:argininosuccinate lyase